MMFMKLSCKVKSLFRYAGKEQVLGTVEGTVAVKRPRKAKHGSQAQDQGLIA